MKYKITYELETGLVISMEQVTTATIEMEDGEVYEDFSNGVCRARVVNGVLERDTSEVAIEENIVPSAAVAEALGLDPNVGIPKAELEQLASDAGVDLNPASAEEAQKV